MSSLRRKLASRANGARSRGPVTPEGKACSAQNAISHGLLAQAVVLKSENPDAFRAHMDDFVLRWQPADQVELGLVEEMAVANWRLRRLWAIETRSLDDAIDAAVSPDRVGRLT